MSRWITVRQPFDYHWPDRSALTAFSEEDCGDHFVKDELADFAVEKGYATEGKVDGSSRSKKGNGAKASRKRKAAPAKAADTRTVAPVGDKGAADADRATGGQPVDPDA